MADVEQRFALEAFAFPTGEPGLILETDGTVWIVAVDGSRTQLSGGGGGGLAGVTSTVSTGNVAIEPDVGADGAIYLRPDGLGTAGIVDSGGDNSVTVGPNSGVQIDGGSSHVNIVGPSSSIVIDDAGLQFGAAAMSFFGGVPAAKPGAPSSAQELYDALVELGLITAGGVIGGDPVEAVHLVGSGGGEPDFENSWHNHTSFGSFTPAGFYKDRGRVYLQGVVESGTQQAWTLPVGYRPPFQVVLSGDSQTTGSSLSGNVVTAGGLVFPQSDIHGLFSLDGLSFRVDE